MGAKVRDRQPSEHAVGCAYIPSGKVHRTVPPHLPHTKDMCVTRGRTGLLRMTVPRRVTSFPANVAFSLNPFWNSTHTSGFRLELD